MRHPKFCRYFGKYNNCKFGTYCKFRHDRIVAEEGEPRKYDEDIDNLKIKIEDYNSKIKEKEKEIKVLEKILSEKISELERIRNIDNENLNSKTKVEDLQENLKEADKKVEELVYENDSLRNTVAVNDMLHEDFKERMKDKYLYDSEDDESDYDSDEESREKKRQKFRNKKQENRLKAIREDKMKSFQCENCEFKGKTEAGLKTHKRIKHRENHS